MNPDLCADAVWEGDDIWCRTCRAFGDHYTDRHPREYVADPWGEDEEKDSA